MHTESPSSGDSPAMRAARDIAFGSFAGMVSEVFEYPLDLVKVRMQSQVLDTSAGTARFMGPLDCLKATWKNEGVRGLYRGLPAPLFGAMAETAALFLAYSELQTSIRWFTSKKTSDELSISQLGLAAGGAGFLTSFILTPIELVKCRMQVQMLYTPVHIPPIHRATAILATSHPGYLPPPPVAPLTLFLDNRAKANSVRKALPGPISIIRSIIAGHGLGGLWLGHTGTLLRETCGTAAWFATKEWVASLLIARKPQFPPRSKDDLAPWESAVSGAMAGGACVLAIYPADTIKSAIQTARPTSKMIPLSFVGTAKAMYRAQGIRGLYVGCGMTVARAIPSSGIVFVVYDGLSQRFG